MTPRWTAAALGSAAVLLLALAGFGSACVWPSSAIGVTGDLETSQAAPVRACGSLPEGRSMRL